MSGELLALLTSYGLPALFVILVVTSAGAPFPDSLLLVAVGSFVAQGDLAFLPVIIVGTLGAVAGDQVGYALGYWGGRPLAGRVAGSERIAKAEAFSRKWGGPGIFFSRWLVGPLGPWINITSGLTAYPWPRFLLLDVVGELIWVRRLRLAGTAVQRQGPGDCRSPRQPDLGRRRVARDRRVRLEAMGGTERVIDQFRRQGRKRAGLSGAFGVDRAGARRHPGEMRFFSDNAAACHPAVLDALAEANRLDTAYDGDAWSKQLDGLFSDLFETRVRALWVTTGTAANCLALAAMCPPFGAILCHRDAHIEGDEAGAPGFFTHGAKLMLLDGEGAKITPEAVDATCDGIRADVHRVQPHALSITNATEYGLAYRAAEVAALGEVAKRRGLGFHMDGARFANAIAATGKSPADVTWRAGVDALSFGFVKNGGMSSEALIFFDEKLADDTLVRRKRAGHLLSKGRYQAAQLLALVENDRWLENGRAANAAAAVLAEAAANRLVHPVEANELFVRMTPGRGGAASGARLRLLRLGAGRSTAGDELGPRHGRGGAAGRRDRGLVIEGHPHEHRFRDIVLPFILFTLIWSSTWLVIRFQLGPVPAQWSVTYRFTIAATAMAVMATIQGHSLRLDPTLARAALLIGVSQFCVNFNGVYLAERFITSGLVATVFGLLLIPNSLFAWAMLGHRPGGRFLLSALVAVAGIALLFLHELHDNPAIKAQIGLGIVLTGTALIGASIANVYQALERVRRYPISVLLAWSMAVGAIVDGCVALMMTGPPVFDPRPSYWLGLTYLSLVASVLAFSLYFPVVRRIGPGKAAYSSVLTPIIAMALSTAFEGYRWTLLAASGAALALGGMVLALGGRRPAR